MAAAKGADHFAAASPGPRVAVEAGAGILFVNAKVVAEGGTLHWYPSEAVGGGDEQEIVRGRCDHLLVNAAAECSAEAEAEDRVVSIHLKAAEAVEVRIHFAEADLSLDTAEDPEGRAKDKDAEECSCMQIARSTIHYVEEWLDKLIRFVDLAWAAGESLIWEVKDYNVQNLAAEVRVLSVYMKDTAAMR